MYTLFDYQVPIVDKIRLALERTGRALVDMATGTGKTVVGAYAIKRLVKQGRGLFLCHNNQILEQSLKTFREVLGSSVTLGLFNGQKKEWNEVDILFASFQTMENWKHVFHAGEFRYIIVDESHHAQAVTFKPVIDYFSPNYRLALTATPDRMDGKDIREIFGEEVVKLTLEEAIGKGYLADVEYRLLSDNLDNEALKKLAHEVLKEGKRIPLSKINETIFIEARDEKVAETILGYGKKKVIVFCESIAHADNFKDFLPESKVYHSGKSDDANDRTLKAFRKGGFDRLIAVDSFNEGMDIPEVEMIVFLRCTDSKRIFLQQLGRGLRKTREKKVVIVLDFVANIERMMVIRDMAEQIRIISANTLTQGAKPRQEKLHIKGNSYDFVFSDEEINILEILEKLQPRHVSDVPELLKEYSARNILPASQVCVGTHNKLWWKCSKPECGYEWQAVGSSRVKGKGCPACSNKVVTEKNNLAITHPELAKEYSAKNPRPANEVIAGTNNKLWWKCSKPECGHEWQAVGNNRVRGNGCPSCSGNEVTDKNNLAVTHPELAKEYSAKNPCPQSLYYSVRSMAYGLELI